MAASEVGPGLFLIQDLLAAEAGEGQGVETYGALGPPGIQLLPQGLQVLHGGSAREALGRAPQEGGAAQVDQRAVLQGVGLVLHLGRRMGGGRKGE